MTDAAAIKSALVDVRSVLHSLGLLDGAQRQAGGYLIRCPWHRERTPSCSVQSRGGGIVAHCFSCDAGGDVLALVAAVHGLDPRTDFARVLELAADLGGVEVPSRPAAEPEPAADYPNEDELGKLLEITTRVNEDAEVVELLRSRGLDPHDVAVRDLALALPPSFDALPPWARFRGRSWVQAGYRLILPVYDHQGTERSVRAWRVVDGEGPKRVAPAGCRMSGLVLADSMTREVLRAGGWPTWNPHPPRIVVVEGEPDFLSWAVRTPLNTPPDRAVVGLLSGAWCEAIAARIPDGAEVVVRTHQDAAGDKYAALVGDSLRGRCKLLRPKGPTT